MYPYNPSYCTEMQTEGAGLCLMGHLAHIQYEDVAAADADVVHAAITADDTDPVVVTTGFTAPDFARNITATSGGTTADIKAVQVVVEGTNLNDEVITETLPVFTENTATTVVGSKAFKTVTKVTIPAMDGAAATVTIGVGDKLGIPFKLAHNTNLFTFLDNVKEGTAATVAMSTTALESNTIDLNSALDGHTVDAYFII